jgi:hypothetical protein
VLPGILPEAESTRTYIELMDFDTLENYRQVKEFNDRHTPSPWRMSRLPSSFSAYGLFGPCLVHFSSWWGSYIAFFHSGAVTQHRAIQCPRGGFCQKTQRPAACGFHLCALYYYFFQEQTPSYLPIFVSCCKFVGFVVHSPRIRGDGNFASGSGQRAGVGKYVNHEHRAQLGDSA